jgi:peptidoglycan/LPS O-acetylase OafA/YrhL
VSPDGAGRPLHSEPVSPASTVPVRPASSGGPVAAGGSRRLTSLDGLRGLAALVVVVHHCALTLPSLARQQQAPDRGSSAWWVAYTPAHLLWAGGEAVLVFFVLSGLVLALPQLRAPRRGTWLPYYLKRAVRLYVPVAAGVVLTGAVVTLVPRVGDPGWSWWMNSHAVPAQVSVLVHDAGLLGGTGWLNSALWSLRYEVFFSLLLPLFVGLARSLTAPLWISLPLALWGIGWAASISHELLSYLFVFAVGVLLAQRLGTLAEWADRIGRSARPGTAWALIGSAGLMLLGEWWLKLLVSDWTLWTPVGRPSGVLGAAVLVFCFLHCPPVRALGDHRVVQWLGTVSFSLYLVHEPIVVSVATMTPPTLRGLAVTLVVGTVLSLLTAVLFFRLVERPSHRLSAEAGRIARRWSGERAPSVDAVRAAAGPGPVDTVQFPSGPEGAPRRPAPAVPPRPQRAEQYVRSVAARTPAVQTTLSGGLRR